MDDYITDWNKLTSFQKELAINNYAAIRENEENKPCSIERAARLAPFCRGYWIDTRYGFVTCNI